MTAPARAAIVGLFGWFDGSDDYGRPNWMLYAIVKRDAAPAFSEPRWGAQVVVTQMPRTWTELHPQQRYMVTSWMTSMSTRKPPAFVELLDEAMRLAEVLVAEQQRRAGIS